MTIIISIVITLLVFGLLVIIHELGHYIAARAMGVGIKEFAIGMGPVIFKKIKNGIKYSLRLLPIGGFLSMMGEDEDCGNDPKAFNNKPIWRRFIVLFAGSAMNLILGFIIVAVIVCTTPMGSTTVGEFSPSAKSNVESGLMTGDKILSINGSSVFVDYDVPFIIAMGGNDEFKIKVKRGNDTLLLENINFGSIQAIITNESNSEITDYQSLKNKNIGVILSNPAEALNKDKLLENASVKAYADINAALNDLKNNNIEAVMIDKSAVEYLYMMKAGYQHRIYEMPADESGESIKQAVISKSGDVQIATFNDLSEKSIGYVLSLPDITVNKYTPQSKTAYDSIGAALSDLTNGKIDVAIIEKTAADEYFAQISNLKVTAEVNNSILKNPTQDFVLRGENKNFGTVVSYTFNRCVSLVRMVYMSVGKLVTGKLSFNAMSGPIGITNQVNEIVKSGVADWSMLWFFIMTLAVNLGIMNLLPLPALDGGRIIFLIIELIRRKPIKPKYEGVVHTVGFALLIVLMIAISFKDILSWFR